MTSIQEISWRLVYKIAKNYYAPGWWEVGPQLSAYVNTAKWDSLSPEYKAIVEAAGAEANLWMMAKYDAENPIALRRLLAGGAKLHFFPQDIMTAALKASNELYDEIAGKNQMFAKIYESWRAFRAENVAWFRVGENSINNFMGNHTRDLQVPKKK